MPRPPRPLRRRARARTAILGALSWVALCGGCASDDPTWEAVRGDWSVFTGIPEWFEKEFERSGKDLDNDATWMSRSFESNLEETRNLPRNLVALAEEDTRSSLAGLEYQGQVISRSFGNNVESFENDILGAPGWVGGEFDRAGEELGVDLRWITDRVERQSEEFWPEVQRYLRALLR